MTNIPINFESASSTAASQNVTQPDQTTEPIAELNGSAPGEEPKPSVPAAAPATPAAGEWFTPIPVSSEPVGEAPPLPAPDTQPLPPPASGEATGQTQELTATPAAVNTGELNQSGDKVAVTASLSGEPKAAPAEEKRLEVAEPAEPPAKSSGGLTLDETVQLLSDLATLQENLMRAEEQTLKAHRHVEIVKEQLAKVNEEKNSWQEQLLRQRAEFDNYRKRVEREKQEIRQSTRVEVIAPILEVLDNLERALALGHSDTGNLEAFLSGIELIQKQMLSALTNFGLSPVAAVGLPFDPVVHEAVVTQETSDYKPNTVLDELKRGYMLGDRLLRPAMVRVSVRPTQSEPEE
ncbi:MAG: nucleotide exchange factor GrpE [Blastocatellia bacterium]|nr:nucleotide exchange factor GrpE [Blastocatellia bacterium]